MNPTLLRRLAPVLAGSLCLVYAGCQSAPVSSKQAAIFYPQTPEPPRLQYLTSLSSEEDLGRELSKFESFVVGKQTSKKPIGKPYGIALRGNQLYVCDLAYGSVDILDLKARSFRYFTPATEGKLITPINVAIDQDGTRYITDSGRGQVLIYSQDDRYLGAIGTRVVKIATPGTPVGDVMKPSDVLVTPTRLFVSDLKGHCVRVYDKAKQELLYTIPRQPEAADAASRLFSPVNLATDAQGRIYVSDLGAFRIQQYESDGRFIRTFGLGAGDKPGEFARPKGIAVDREGRLYVVDAGTQVAQIFDAEGRLLLYFGEMRNDAPGLDLPAKLIVDYDHVGLFQSYAAPGFKIEYLVLVTNQFGDRKVNVYGFGHAN